jgi:FdhD protein
MALDAWAGNVPDPPRAGPAVDVRIGVLDGTDLRPRFDRVATEEPLEIRLRAGTLTRTVAITMRTPGNDVELAAGFLFGEGIVRAYDDLAGISFCIDPDVDVAQRYNIVNVDLARAQMPALQGLDRHFMTTSACGVCGKANIEELQTRGCVPLAGDLRVAPETLFALPGRLRAAQGVFQQTGGLHAAALFDRAGTLLAVREDVGRHNAVDKLVGWALLQRRLPMRDAILLVSGRASYEILQKAIVAETPVVCSVSAASSLAVELARAFGVTLLGFLRERHCNVYSGAERIAIAAAPG